MASFTPARSVYIMKDLIDHLSRQFARRLSHSTARRRRRRRGPREAGARRGSFFLNAGLLHRHGALCAPNRPPALSAEQVDTQTRGASSLSERRLFDADYAGRGFAARRTAAYAPPHPAPTLDQPRLELSAVAVLAALPRVSSQLSSPRRVVFALEMDRRDG